MLAPLRIDEMSFGIRPVPDLSPCVEFFDTGLCLVGSSFSGVLDWPM